MTRWRQLGIFAGVCAVGVLSLVAVLQFLAPTLSYQIRDRFAEVFSGNSGRTYRIGLGVRTGSYYQLGVILNRYLKEKAGYELELVETAGVPENVGALLNDARGIDLATIESSSDEAAKSDGLYSLAVVGRQYFFVVVPNANTVSDVRDLAGAINPGLRGEGQPPTLGEKVLEYYGKLSSVTVVRPTSRGLVKDFDAGHMAAVTRTQFLQADLIVSMLRGGHYRLVPIRDHEALAQSLPGTEPGFIPAGAYGPERRIPSEPVPTITVSSLLIARRDLPGRVARDILDVLYDPRFGRDIQQHLTEERGRQVGVLPLHPAAEIFYHRNDLVTADRLGRLSFVAWIVGAAFAMTQFVSSFRRSERQKARRRLLMSELAKLKGIRRRMDEGIDPAEARVLIAEVDELLSNAEEDAAVGLLDAEGIQALRSLHGICRSTLQQRLTAS